MTMQIFIPHSNFNAGCANASRFEAARNFILGLYVAWKRERIRKANLHFVMGLDPIVLRDLGYTREEICRPA